MHLLDQGQKVRCLVAPFERSDDLRALGCEVMTGDITKRADIMRAITPDINAVVHLADTLTETKEVKFSEFHVDSTRYLIDACKSNGIKRFVFSSTIGAGPHAKTAYQRSKWEAEDALRNSGLEYTIFRPTVVYGKGDWFTSYYADAIKNHRYVMIPDGGENNMQPLYVDDFVLSLLECLNRVDTIGKTYDIGGPEVYTFNQVVEKIEEEFGVRRYKIHMPIFVMDSAASVYEFASSNPRLTKDLVMLMQQDAVAYDNALMKVFNVRPTGFKEGLDIYLKPELAPPYRKAA